MDEVKKTYLLGLRTLLQLAHSLFLVAAALTGDHRWDRFWQPLADPLGLALALLDADSTGSLVALGVLAASAVGLGLAVGRLGRVALAGAGGARVAAVRIARAATIGITRRAGAVRVAGLGVGRSDRGITVEGGRGAAGAVVDGVLDVAADGILQGDAGLLLFDAARGLVDGIANALVDLVALLDDEGHLEQDWI